MRWLLIPLFMACAGDDGPKTSSPTDGDADTDTDADTDADTDTDTMTTEWPCVLEGVVDPVSAPQLGCLEDFDTLASLPLDASIPGARSIKTIVDQIDGNELYFINSKVYPIHWDFASTHLSGNGLPQVPDLGGFNITEYYSPDRRFLLGAVTYYEGPDVYAYDIAPYDTADAAMVETAFDLIRDNAWFGPRLRFHPSSSNMEETLVPLLPADIPIVTTDELFEGIDYQPLNLGTGTGVLAFYEAKDLVDSYVNPCEVVVLDEVPNDISVTAGIITDAFQTPLAHINVLSQNRGTPNMGLKGAFDNKDLRDLEGKWVQLTVDAFEWHAIEVDPIDGQTACDASKPEPLGGNPMDLTVQTFVDAEDILDLETYSLGDALQKAIPAFGGKASHFGGLTQIGPDVPTPDAFSIPMYFYNQFMIANGFDVAVADLLNDATFQIDPAYRAVQLSALQARIEVAPMDPEFMAMLREKITADYGAETSMRFRSSTNAEDLGGFTGAGLYTSKAGFLDDPTKSVEDAIRKVWASVWGARAYEERDWYGIDHSLVGMALLVHPSFPEEEANGVAITANIFDTTGLEPGFYVNTQFGDNSVVLPVDGDTTDQFIYYFDSPGQPIVYLAHSNLVPPGETVLSVDQVYTLGVALSAIRAYFLPVYGTSGGFYGMDTEFKFDAPPCEEPVLFMKQARPYPGWNSGN
jgi:hypothetical protein